MTRKILPQRRPNVTHSIDWNGHPLDVTIGFDPETGQPSEVFANTAKGGDMHATLADTSVILSIVLQHGIAPAELAKSLGRMPVLWADEGTTQPASPVGAIVEAILAEVR